MDQHRQGCSPQNRSYQPPWNADHRRQTNLHQIPSTPAEEPDGPTGARSPWPKMRLPTTSFAAWNHPPTMLSITDNCATLLSDKPPRLNFANSVTKITQMVKSSIADTLNEASNNVNELADLFPDIPDLSQGVHALDWRERPAFRTLPGHCRSKRRIRRIKT